MLEPASLLTRHPFSTVQLEAFEGLSKYQHEWSRPLNRVVVFPHLVSVEGFRAGARLPVQVQGVPSGPVAVPIKVSESNFPSNSRSVLLPSSSFGETKWIESRVIVSVGKRRACPH